MLTPAEEIGLSGLSLASKVRKAFQGIPGPQLLDILARIREESLRRHLIYLRDGEPTAVHVMACPMTILPDQLAYVHSVTLTIHNALKRLPDLYFEDADVREMLRLPPEEEEWMRLYWGERQRECNPAFGRHDAVVDFISPMWKETLKFLEPNMGGIGGLHLVPTAENILADLVIPELRHRDELLQLELCPDIRELLMQDVLDHLEAIGRPAKNIALIEPKYAGSGPDEQEYLARYYHDRYGMRVFHADPSELTLAKGEVCCEGTPIDLVYRDYTVTDFLDLERQGIDIRPVRTLFEQNRVISSVTAELDQKSCWEVLTDPAITNKYFNSDERQVFRRHILWTRLISDRNTILPDGRAGDLLEYVRQERERLVMKPNRAYGGQGVLIGPSVDERAWEAAIHAALADTDRWVVQQIATLPVSEFPIVGPDKCVHMEPFYTVMGFAPSKYGLAILGRASQRQVVNVAQRGGMCVVALGHPPGRLIGPGHLPIRD
ncbi:MAG: hypothetical protein ACKVT0_11405 [Planctomycetaceae bacterium]